MPYYAKYKPVLITIYKQGPYFYYVFFKERKQFFCMIKNHHWLICTNQTCFDWREFFFLYTAGLIRIMKHTVPNTGIYWDTLVKCSGIYILKGSWASMCIKHVLFKMSIKKTWPQCVRLDYSFLKMQTGCNFFSSLSFSSSKHFHV